MKEQLTCFDIDEAKKASSSKQSVSNCEYLLCVLYTVSTCFYLYSSISNAWPDNEWTETVVFVSCEEVE